MVPDFGKARVKDPGAERLGKIEQFIFEFRKHAGFFPDKGEGDPQQIADARFPYAADMLFHIGKTVGFQPVAGARIASGAADFLPAIIHDHGFHAVFKSGFDFLLDGVCGDPVVIAVPGGIHRVECGSGDRHRAEPRQVFPPNSDFPERFGERDPALIEPEDDPAFRSDGSAFDPALHHESLFTDAASEQNRFHRFGNGGGQTVSAVCADQRKYGGVPAEFRCHGGKPVGREKLRIPFADLSGGGDPAVLNVILREPPFYGEAGTTGSGFHGDDRNAVRVLRCYLCGSGEILEFKR